MPDKTTPEERRLIDAAIKAGRVRRIPTGVSGEDPTASRHWKVQQAHARKAMDRNRMAAQKRNAMVNASAIMVDGRTWESQAALARELGVSAKSVSYWVNAGTVVQNVRKRLACKT